jgi:hypothetical protein
VAQARTVRLVEIAELLGVSKQRAHQLADEDGFRLRFGREGQSPAMGSARGHGVGKALAAREALALAHELHEHHRDIASAASAAYSRMS